MAKQKGSATSTQQSGPPQWFSDTATQLYAPHLQPTQHRVAGQTADHAMAGDLARRHAAQAFNSDWSGQIAGAGGGYSPTLVDGAAIREHMNDYLHDVGRSTLGAMGRERDIADARLGARNASAVAFGGSGPALERAQLNRAHGEQVGSTINQLMAQGYDRAVATAMANAQMANQAEQHGSSQGLAAAIAANSAFGDTMNRQQSALHGLLGIGDRNQAHAQRILDVPYNSLSQLAGLLGSTTTQQQPIYGNPLASLIGLGNMKIWG